MTLSEFLFLYWELIAVGLCAWLLCGTFVVTILLINKSRIDRGQIKYKDKSDE